MLAAGPLKLVVRAGRLAYNTTMSRPSSRRGLRCELSGKKFIAVAELAFALILALDRRIADNVDRFARGERKQKEEFSKARGLFGRTLGWGF